MSRRFITIKEPTNAFDGTKTVKFPFFAIFSLLFKIHLALLTIACIYLIGGAILSMIIMAFTGHNPNLNGLYF